ncbi:IclR family transcriptional regulator [Streptomyces sp. NPDC051018]|uniref:IclR family transcriptional regulator n=1 Tax=Streptomyces sp. NPDC051018 TaxID=3365639 RepID=UPI00379896B2
MTSQTQPVRSMLARGLSILHSFRPGESELTLSEIARRTALPKATAHRLISELVDAGMLERAERGLRLGLNLFALGTRVPRQRIVRELALPHLNRMHDLTRQTVFLYLSDGLDGAMADSRGGRGPRAAAYLPAESEASASAVAQVFRAHRARSDPAGPDRARRYRAHRAVRRLAPEELGRVAEQGFAVAHCGLEAVAVAVPVLDATDSPVAALAVAGSQDRLHLLRTASPLRAAGAELSRDLRGAPGMVPAL